jgi:hypothetical protein
MIAATSASDNLLSNECSSSEGERQVSNRSDRIPHSNNQGIISAEIQVNETPVKNLLPNAVRLALLATTTTTT